MAPQRPPQDEPYQRPSHRDAYERAKNNSNPAVSGANGQRPTERPYQPVSPGQPVPPAPGQLFTTGQNDPRGQGGSRLPPYADLHDRYRPAPGQPGLLQPGTRRPPRRPLRLKIIAGYAFLIIAVVGGLIFLYSSTRLFNFLGNISVERKDAAGKVINQSSITGSGRVNIVLLGLDRRPNDNEGTRSDSMLILSVDQDTKTANMLSIPRDLWVKIPGFSSNRVNAAYFFGDQKEPGKGGPPLVKATIQENFGIKIDYFAEIDFNGFRSIIDSIGGISLDVKKPLLDNEYPTEDYGIKRIYIPAGVQRLDGHTALQYARSRHADSDLGRNQRQQEVLLAVREQGVNLGLLTNTRLQSALQDTVKTDLSPGDMLALGQIAVGLKRESIRQFSIDANIAHPANIGGNDVLQAEQTALKQLLQEFQASSKTQISAAARETAQISIQNGTFISGLASRTQKYLEGKGLTILGVGQSSEAGNYPQTVINVYTGKQKAASELATLLGLGPGSIKIKSGGAAGLDIELICGEDLKLPQ